MKNGLLYLAILSIFAFMACSDARQTANAATATTVQSQKSAKSESAATTAESNMPIVIDFYADWCGPCQQFKPVFEKAEKSYKGKIQFHRVNVDNDRGMAEQFNIMYLPTILFFDANGNEIARQTGYMNYDQLNAQLEKMLK